MLWDKALLAPFPTMWYLGWRLSVQSLLLFQLSLGWKWARVAFYYFGFFVLFLRGRWDVGRDAKVFSLFPPSLLVL